jgi:hypothetical protein
VHPHAISQTLGFFQSLVYCATNLADLQGYMAATRILSKSIADANMLSMMI